MSALLLIRRFRARDFVAFAMACGLSYAVAPASFAQEVIEETDISQTFLDDESAEPIDRPIDEVTGDAEQPSSQQLRSELQPGMLRFSFDGTPWRDVINWLAEEGGLALHVSELPTGSFTYSDPSAFKHQDAIDRVNLFLLPQGFTLVRSGQLLTVINLSDPRSMQQLDAMADLVTVDQLADRNNYDVVKCIFPLGDIESEDAVNELSALKLMTTPAVFTKTNQIMITDTAGKLKNVKAVLDAFSTDEMDNGTVVKNFVLQHVEAEDVLLVARPHMGLATGEMIGIDVSLSADLQGHNIFITGVEDKVKLLESLVAAIDVPQKTMTNNGENVLKSHVVSGGNVETVYNVLLTLLADQEVRLSMDTEANAVVALATPQVQKEIEDTVTQLQANEADFEVIPLKTADPYFVISLLEEMLDPLDDDADAPKIDADPGNMRLFVRAKRPQIDQIKKIVQGLDSTAIAGSDDSDFRVLPLKGKEAERVLQTASKFWRGDNPVILYRSADSILPASTERVVTGEPNTPDLSAEQIARLDLRSQVVLANPGGRDSAIQCQVTPRGLLLQSADTEALGQFEEHIRAVAGPLDSMPSAPVVFYLKYTKSDDAIRVLAELLDGGESAKEGEAGTLVNGFTVGSMSDGFLGSIVTSRDGTTTMMAGSITVVADTRLNRLIAQGTTSDIESIEAYLKIIDKDNSITSIETYGTSRVIELTNTKASEVAEVIRQAYSSRIAGGTSKGASGASGGKSSGGDIRAVAEAAVKAAAAASKDKKGSKSSSQPENDLEPKMTIAVHEPSNSLIVTAPEALFAQVERLAQAIDARGEQAVEVITPLNGEVFEAVLQRMMGQEPTQRPSTTQSRSSSASSRSSRSK